MMQKNQSPIRSVKSPELSDFCNRQFWFQAGYPNSVKFVMTPNLLEYATSQQAAEIAGNIFEFLKPGGHWRVIVPDANNPSKLYRIRHDPDGNTQKFLQLIGKRHGRIFYNITSLTVLLEAAGFAVKPLVFYGESGDLNVSHPDFHIGLTKMDEHPSLPLVKSDAHFDNAGLIVEAIKPVSSGEVL